MSYSAQLSDFSNRFLDNLDRRFREHAASRAASPIPSPRRCTPSSERIFHFEDEEHPAHGGSSVGAPALLHRADPDRALTGVARLRSALAAGNGIDELSAQRSGPRRVVSAPAILNRRLEIKHTAPARLITVLEGGLVKFLLPSDSESESDGSVYSRETNAASDGHDGHVGVGEHETRGGRNWRCIMSGCEKEFATAYLLNDHIAGAHWMDA